MDAQAESPIDTGLRSLVTIARFHQLPTEEPQIQYQFGVPGELFGDTEILRAAKSLGFKTRQTTLTFEKLNNSILPAIIVTKNGEYAVLVKVAQASELSAVEGEESEASHQGKALSVSG
ncbi:MAG: cysteine peptidase family C39 domain-containing protein [Amphritea sp.]|nr:cysteine peptidase family C39 domain-containing protein [Amphritea sp.]